jgi:hypothetical protein
MSQLPSQPPPPPPPDWQPGAPLAGYGVVVPQRTSAAAVTSLVLGILGCVPLLTGLLAVAFGLAGIRTTRDPRIRGRGLAIAGLVLGLVSLAGWSLFGGLIGVGYARSRPARAAAEQFTTNLAAGDVTTAQSRCTGTVPRPSLDAAAATMRPWGPLSDFTASNFNYSILNGTETCSLTGAATFANNTRANFSFRLVKHSGAFRVDSFSIANQKGAATPATIPASASPAATQGG